MNPYPEDLELDLPHDHWLAKALIDATLVGDAVFLTIDVPSPVDGSDPRRLVFSMSRYERCRSGRHGIWDQVKIRFGDHARVVKWIDSLTSWPSTEH